jgi:hypothetical protein
MTANHDGELSDAELDAVLSAADDDLLACIRSAGNPDAALLAIMEAGDKASVPVGTVGSGDPAAAPAAAIAAGIRSVARAVELAVSVPGGAVRIGVSTDEEPQEGPSAPSPESAAPARGIGSPVDVAGLIREFNASNERVEEQWLRARQAASTAARSAGMADLAEAAARSAIAAHRAVQAECPHRRAPLARQVAFVLGTVMLDGVGCYFAAQALGGSLFGTLAWTGLFLAVLGGGLVALDYYRDRRRRAWRALAALLGAFVAGLGVLRLSYLASTGAAGPAQAIAGGCLFAAVTAGLLCIGYRALRAAESPPAWRARQRARTAFRAARAARAAALSDAAERDHLIDAYLRQVWRLAPATCLDSRQLAAETAIRACLDPTEQARIDRCLHHLPRSLSPP